MISPINGWTKKRIIARIKKRVPEYGCVDGRGVCIYRRDDGKGCIVGAFMPPRLAKKMDLGGVLLIQTTLRAYPEIMQHIPLPFQTMRTLQRMHDEKSTLSLPVRDDLIRWVEENVCP